MSEINRMEPPLPVKPPFSYEEQVAQLCRKGIVVEDPTACTAFLNQASYYRLSAYFLPFKRSDGTYLEGISFSRVQRIYEFDSHIRALLFPVIETIEFYIRTQFGYYIAFHYGPLGYQDEAMFNARHKKDIFASRVKTCIEENRRTPIVLHHNQKYGGQFPIWVLIEFFSMGMLSYLYADLLTPDKKKLARASFGTSAECLESWLRCLTDLRNRCAHYARLYYWSFSAIPKMPRSLHHPADRRLFSQILMLKLLYPDPTQWNREIFPALKTLLEAYLPDISLVHIGFPENWEELLTFSFYSSLRF